MEKFRCRTAHLPTCLLPALDQRHNRLGDGSRDVGPRSRTVAVPGGVPRGVEMIGHVR
jgi:hypothetical protein